MEEEASRDEAKAIEYKNALNMAPYEKTISFLNRYFIYKKSNHIDAEKLTNALLKKNAQEYVNEMVEPPAITAAAQEPETKEDAGAGAVEATPLKIKAKPRTKKLVTKLRITDLDAGEEPAAPVAAAPVNSTVAPAIEPDAAPVVEIQATVIEEPIIKIKVKKPRATKK
jgi:hypothetical protein